MLAQRLQILLGHSTFLQAFQHSGASPRWPMNERLLDYCTVSLAHMRGLLLVAHYRNAASCARDAAERSLLQAARSGGRARSRQAAC